MTRTLLSAAGALVLTVFALSSGAQAQCYWTGWSTVCAAPPATYYVPPYYGSPFAAFNAYDYRDYRYKPDWLPSYPGPRPGGS